MTAGQQRAFEELWPRWGIDFSSGETLDPERVFNNAKPTYVEIGFGNGESLASYAKRHPHNNYIGIEVHRPGVGHLLIKIEELGLDNLKVMRHDATEVIRAIPDATLAGAMLFFPDPWHKKKHHKRRILQPALINEMARIIHPGGTFHAATDWEHYAKHMMEVLTASPDFKNLAGETSFSPRPEERPLTKFEQRGQRLGHGVWDLIFERKSDG